MLIMMMTLKLFFYKKADDERDEVDADDGDVAMRLMIERLIKCFLLMHNKNSFMYVCVFSSLL